MIYSTGLCETSKVTFRWITLFARLWAINLWIFFFTLSFSTMIHRQISCTNDLTRSLCSRYKMILEFVIEHRLEFIHHLLSSKVEGRSLCSKFREPNSTFFFISRARCIKLIDIIYHRIYIHVFKKVKYKVKHLEGIVVGMGIF